MTTQPEAPRTACIHCKDAAFRPRTWASWSADERSAWQQAEQTADEHNRAWQLLMTLAEGKPEFTHFLHELDRLDGVRMRYQRDLLTARLKRYLPGLADLIDFAAGDIGMDYHDVSEPHYELHAT